MKKKIIIGTIALVAAVLVFFLSTVNELKNWPFADLQANLDIYTFENGKVKVNETEVGFYSKFYNYITINFYKEVHSVKEVKGKINSKVNITLYFPEKNHELRLRKG